MTNPNVPNSNTFQWHWTNATSNTITFVSWPTPKKEDKMQTSVAYLPEGYVGIVTAPIDQKAVPIARTKAFPFKEYPDVKAEARALKAAKRLALKIARKSV